MPSGKKCSEKSSDDYDSCQTTIGRSSAEKKEEKVEGKNEYLGERRGSRGSGGSSGGAEDRGYQVDAKAAFTCIRQTLGGEEGDGGRG